MIAQPHVVPDLKKGSEHVRMVHAMEILKKLPNAIKKLVQVNLPGILKTA